MEDKLSKNKYLLVVEATVHLWSWVFLLCVWLVAAVMCVG